MGVARGDIYSTDETNIAKAVVTFLREIGDVYERARLMRSVVGIGDVAATPGFVERLVEHVDAGLRGDRVGPGGQAGPERKQLCEAIDTPFAADCILWSGAAIIGDGAQTAARQDTLLSRSTEPSGVDSMRDEDRISSE